MRSADKLTGKPRLKAKATSHHQTVFAAFVAEAAVQANRRVLEKIIKSPEGHKPALNRYNSPTNDTATWLYRLVFGTSPVPAERPAPTARDDGTTQIYTIVSDVIHEERDLVRNADPYAYDPYAQVFSRQAPFIPRFHPFPPPGQNSQDVQSSTIDLEPVVNRLLKT
jgi:hypothetical protein